MQNKILPDHLELVEIEGELIFGGPGTPEYKIFVKNKNTGQVSSLTIPRPGISEPKLMEFFEREFRKAIKEQLNEDPKY